MAVRGRAGGDHDVGAADDGLHRLRPDVAIAVDVTHATDAPGIDATETGEHLLRRRAGARARGGAEPRRLRAPARHRRAPGDPLHDRGVGRSTGTDADAIHSLASGDPHGLVSIALRYMHSPVEMVQLDDIDACVRLIAAFALALTPQTSFAR